MNNIILSSEKFDKLLDNFSLSELDFLEKSFDALPKGKTIVDVVSFASKERYLPSELTSLPGIFDWSLVPHLIEPAKCFSPDNPTQRVILCKGTQIGGTVGLLENIILHTIVNNPQPVLFMREEKDTAEIAMELRVDRMLELSGFKEKLISYATKKGRKSGDRKLLKQFPGGFIMAIGAKNANKMRSFTFSILLRDEVDAYPMVTVDKEKGDPLELTEKRTAIYPYTKKILDISTPLLMRNSRIWKLLNDSNFKKRFVPCPHCGEFQELVWYDKENDTGFRYEHDNYTLVPGSTYYKCRYCKKSIYENDKFKMFNAGEYRATKKSKLYLAEGYFVPSWYGLFEPWDKTAEDWLKTLTHTDKVKALETFNNTRAAIPFEDFEFQPKPGMLNRGKNRNYNAYIVPNEIAIKDGHGPILVLTCAVDVHKKKLTAEGRLDVEVVGHCRDGAIYSILWIRLEGDTEAYWVKEFSAAYQAKPEDLEKNTWYQLEQIMAMTFQADDGKNAYRIRLTGVDSAYQTYMVQTFCRQYTEGLVSLFGVGRERNLVDKFKLKKGDHGQYYELVVDRYKDMLADFMSLKWSGMPMPQPPGYLNFPASEIYNKEFFDMYGNEVKVAVYDDKTGRYKGSYWKKRYDKAPNHAWDCRVYNMALLDIFVYNLCQGANIEGLDYKEVFDSLEGTIAK